MTRGRKKDPTIPISRALVQQRDYRARRTQQLSDLEFRCRRAEAENAYLRNQMRTMKTRPPLVVPTIPPEIVKAAEELIHSLNSTSAAIIHFKKLAVKENPQESPSPPPPPTTNPWPLRPALFTPKLSVSKLFTPTTDAFYRKSRATEQPLTNDADKPNDTVADRWSQSPTPSWGDEYDELDEEDPMERRDEGGTALPAPTLVRMSGLRFTSDGTA